MSTQSHLDLTEFVSKLIHDTFNAITVSSKEQAETHYEMTRLASLDFPAFRDRYITDDMIDDELVRLFPNTEDKEHLHLIYEGAPYFYNRTSQAESPSLFSILNVEVSPVQKRRKRLMVETIQLVRTAVQNELAQQHYDSFGEVLQRGIPRVIIDSGKITAKMSLKTEEIETESASPATVNAPDSDSTNEHSLSLSSQPTRASLSRTTSRLDTTIFNKKIADKLSKTRVGVFLPDPQSATGNSESTLWGEVEISFKTID